jgi:hypothetical protein
MENHNRSHKQQQTLAELSGKVTPATFVSTNYWSAEQTGYGLSEQLEGVRKSITREDRASDIYQKLEEAIINFENGLTAEEEVGIRLVSFGETITLHVTDMDYIDPLLMVFHGVTSDNRPMKLIQHISQTNFLLMAVPRLDKSRERIGFKSKG